MIAGMRPGWAWAPVVTALALGACQLPRPDVDPSRMLEPQLLEPASAAAAAPGAGAVAVRLVDTEAREHIGRRLLHLRPDGELVEDPVWRWSSAPARYLDTALRLVGAAGGTVRFVDTSGAPTLSVRLLAWHLEPGDQGEQRLVGTVEVSVTGTDRSIDTGIVRASESVSSVLPGDLAAAAGRLLRNLASQCLARVKELPRQ